jgi:hypothetical protein
MESSEPSRLGSFLSMDMSSAISFRKIVCLVLLPHYDYPSTTAVVPATITTKDLQHCKHQHKDPKRWQCGLDGRVAITCGIQTNLARLYV